MGAFTRTDKKGISDDFDYVYNLFPRLLEREGQMAGTLSGGEQQRISIARAILKNAPILILDEATAFADPDNEAKVQQAINELAKDKTVIMIAHRLSTIANAHKIYVLEGGKIAESGTNDELVAMGGIYADMMKNYVSSVNWKVSKEGK